METVPRHIQPEIEAALEWSRVVMVHGARQTGKTTLARGIAEARGGTYVSLDDDEERESVLFDPVAFLSSQRYPLTIDEFQLGGNRVIVAIKRLVDEDRTPGRFILTGSTNFLTVPTISESLAGRVRIFRLWPLSEAELAGVAPTEIDHWFEGSPRPAPASDLGRADYFARACRGGYPEVVDLDPGQRRRWPRPPPHHRDRFWRHLPLTRSPASLQPHPESAFSTTGATTKTATTGVERWTW